MSLLLLLSMLSALLMGAVATPSAPPTMPSGFEVASFDPAAPPSGPMESADSEIASAAPSAPPAEEEDDDDDDEEAEVAKFSSGGKQAKKREKMKYNSQTTITRATVVAGSGAKFVNGTAVADKKESNESASVTVPVYAVYLIVGGSAAACALAVGIALMLRFCKRGDSEANKKAAAISQVSIVVTETRA